MTNELLIKTNRYVSNRIILALILPRLMFV